MADKSRFVIPLAFAGLFVIAAGIGPIVTAVTVGQGQNPPAVKPLTLGDFGSWAALENPGWRVVYVKRGFITSAVYYAVHPDFAHHAQANPALYVQAGSEKYRIDVTGRAQAEKIIAHLSKGEP